MLVRARLCHGIGLHDHSTYVGHPGLCQVCRRAWRSRGHSHLTSTEEQTTRITSGIAQKPVRDRRCRRKNHVVLAKCIGRRQKGQATAENRAIYTVVRPGEYLTGADGPDKAGSAREELSARFQMTD